MAIEKAQPISSIEAINDDRLTSSVAPSPANLGIPLHAVFSKDSLVTSAQVEEKPFASSSAQSQSLWSRWFGSAPSSLLEAAPLSSSLDSSLATQSIDFLPRLEAPVASSHSLLESSSFLSSIDQKNKEPLNLFETQKILSQLEGKTIDEIVIILAKYQLLLKKDETKIESKTLEREEEIKELQQKQIDEIKKALAKDKSILNTVTRIQTILKAATLISSICSIGAAIGIAVPPIGLIGATLGVGLGSALSHLGSTYAKSKSAENESAFTLLNKSHKDTEQVCEDRNNRLNFLMDQTASLHETISQQLKAKRQMIKKVLEN